MKASDSKTFTKVEKHIRAMTDAYLELGVCIVEDSWRTAYYTAKENREEALKEYRKEYLSLTSATFVRAYLRAVAKEFKRPFITAEVNPNNITLNIPRKKFLEPLFASFLLGTEAIGYNRKHDELPMYFRGTPTLVRVVFNGVEGRKIFDAFIERCRTEDEYKKALRLI